MHVIDVPGSDRWLPVPLQGDVDAEAEQVVGRLVGDVASRDFLDDTVAAVAGLARIVRRDAERQATDGVLVQLAWSLLPEPGVLLPGPVAVLALRPLVPGTSDDDVIASCADLSAHHGPVEVDVLDTASGRALAVDYRPVLQTERGTVVHEHRLVLWPRPEAASTLELSFYTVDLVLGGHAEEPLLDLARSVSWHPA